MNRPVKILLIFIVIILISYAFDLILKKQKDNIFTEGNEVNDYDPSTNERDDESNILKEINQNKNTADNIILDNEKTVRIEILENRFFPKDITIKKGTTIIWTNIDYKSHKIAAKTILINGSTYQEFYSSIILPNSTYNHTFTREGLFPYFDVVFLKYMKGTITVLE